MIDDLLFWSNTKISVNGCIEWQKCRTQFGYGRLSKRSGPLKGSWLAHRYSYSLINGRPPSGMYVCHSCDNRLCVNPAHLWIGTASDNSKDAYRKGRMKIKNPLEYKNWSPGKMFGSKNRATKLTVKDVLEINVLSKSGLLQREIAKQFGVSQVAISVVLRRKTWASRQKSITSLS